MPQGENKLNYESDLHSNERNLSNSEKKAWKKEIQACTGLEPMTSPILVQCSTNWANKPTGSWSLCWFQIKRNHIKLKLTKMSLTRGYLIMDKTKQF